MFSRSATFWLACLTVALMIVPVHSQEPGIPRDAILTSLGDRVSLFFESVSSGQTSEAFRELLAGSALVEQEDALKQLVEQTAQLATKHGRYRGAEQIGARRIGQDVVLLRYLGKYDQCPVIWSFVYYRPPAPVGATAAEPEPWRIVSVQFHTEWERLWDRSP